MTYGVPTVWTTQRFLSVSKFEYAVKVDEHQWVRTPPGQSVAPPEATVLFATTFGTFPREFSSQRSTVDHCQISVYFLQSAIHVTIGECIPRLALNDDTTIAFAS